VKLCFIANGITQNNSLTAQFCDCYDDSTQQFIREVFMSHLVTVTGATGHIGSGIVERLLNGGHRVRGIIRNKEKFAPLEAKGAEARVGDLSDAEFLSEAFRGSDALFVMIPPDQTVEDIRAEQRQIADNLAKAIEAAGVTRAVALSSIGGQLASGTGPITGLHDLEERLKSVPDLSLVILRPTYFMENFLYWIPLIKSAGICGETVRGDVSMPLIATRDIATVAAEYLAKPTFDGITVRHLLGPRDHTLRESTTILGDAIGKPDLQYVEFKTEDYRKGLLQAGFSESVADAYIEMENSINDGSVFAEATRDESTTTPTTLEEFARDTFAPAFKGAASEARA
jgi:uncharacterized protein YbjT (DUF2867 family)